MNVNELQDDSVLSWSSEEEHSIALTDVEASQHGRNSFVTARSQLDNWIALVRTLASYVRHIVQPSPFLMQQPGNNLISGKWRHSLFINIVEEGLNLDKPVEEIVVPGEVSRLENVMQITMENIQPEVDYWNNIVVCYILGVKPSYKIVDGFIRIIWRKYGVDKVAMMKSSLFMVRFHSIDCKNQALEAGPILYDSKHVIVNEWTLDMDLNVGNVKKCSYLDHLA